MLMLYLKRFLYVLAVFGVASFIITSCFGGDSSKHPPIIDYNSDVEVSQDIEGILATQSVATVLLPESYTTTNGGDGGQPVSNLHVRDQSGQDNDWNTYVEFKTPNGNSYEGYQSFFLPEDIQVADITSLIITVNFLGPTPGEQTWIWQIHNWTNNTWLSLGNNAGASWENGWVELAFSVQGTLDDYVGTDKEVRIQLISDNAIDNADIDYQAVSVMGDSFPAPNETTLTPISYTTTSGSDGGQSVSNLYVQDQQGADNEWQRYVEFKTSQGNTYAGYRSYTLPNDFNANELTSVTLRANFLGPEPAEQEWVWNIYNWTTNTWTNLGNNTGASWEGGWKEFSYEITENLSEYVDVNREIRVQITSDNDLDNADLDYEALVVSTVGSEVLPEPWQQTDFGGIGTSSYNTGAETFTLSTSGTGGEATHYVYQERSGNFTAQACVQSLISNDPIAKAGLMLRQDNSDTSEYVYIGLMSTGTEVKHVDNTGTVHTVSGEQGTSTPRCYQLDKQEDSVYVYESGDGVNWVLVTTITLSLVDPVNVGLAADSEQEDVQAVFDEVTVEAQAPPSEVTAVFTATPTSGRVPLTVQFDASSSEGSDLTYTWDFGDGTTASEVQVSHTFTEAQQYSVTLTVENTSGQDTTSQIVVVFAEDAMTQIEGDPSDPALQALPMFFDGYDLDTDFTLLDGYYVPIRLIEVTFKPNVTIGEVNALIAELQGEIIGASPGHQDAEQYQLGGLDVYLRVPEQNPGNLFHLVTELRDLPNIFSAFTFNIEYRLNAIPQPSPDNDDWTVPQQGGNWGSEISSIPSMWNFNTLAFSEGVTTLTVAVEQGFNSHPDLIITSLVPSGVVPININQSHGNHVLGIMGAQYGNGIGVDGVNPFASLGYMVAGVFASSRDLYNSLTVDSRFTKVVNGSLYPLQFIKSVDANGNEVRDVNGNYVLELCVRGDSRPACIAEVDKEGNRFFNRLQKFWGPRLSSNSGDWQTIPDVGFQVDFPPPLFIFAAGNDNGVLTVG